MGDDHEIEPEASVDRAMADLVATTRSGTLKNLRVHQRFVAGSLLALALRVGLPTYLARPRPFDPTLPETPRLVFLIVLVIIEGLLILICLRLNWHLSRPTAAGLSRETQDNSADDHQLDARRVGFLVAFSFKSMMELACLLFVSAIASQIYIMDDTDWSTANLGIVSTLYLVFWPTAGRMDRWAGRMSLASWTRTIPPEFPT